MERFCTNCGNPLEEGTLFCPECGQKVEAAQTAATNFVAAAAAAAAAPVEEAPAQPASGYTFGMAQPAAEPAPEPAAYTYSAPEPAYSYAAPEPAAPAYSAPEPKAAPAPEMPKAEPPVQETFAHENEYGTVTSITPAGSPVVKTGTYFWLMLLFAVPVIGFIVMIIMAFAAKNKNLKHWVRALLLWVLIGLLLSIILGLVAYILGKNAGINLQNIDYNALFQSIFDAFGI